MATNPFQDVDELQFSRDVLTVYKYLHRASLPKSMTGAVRRLHDWVQNPAHMEKFVANLVPKAQETIKKARAGATTDDMIAFEQKGISELQNKLTEFLRHREKSE